MNANDAKSFCTCRDTKCPFNPVNHDKGCTMCVAKSLSRGEIPSCFFNKADPERTNTEYFFEDFARVVMSKKAGK